MALTQENINAPYFMKDVKTLAPQEAVSSTLTFVMSDGKTILFDGMDVPVGEAAAQENGSPTGK